MPGNYGTGASGNVMHAVKDSCASKADAERALSLGVSTVRARASLKSIEK